MWKGGGSCPLETLYLGYLRPNVASHFQSRSEVCYKHIYPPALTQSPLDTIFSQLVIKSYFKPLQRDGSSCPTKEQEKEKKTINKF